MTKPLPDSHRVKEYLERIRGDCAVAPICIPSIDQLLGGIRPRRINVIAGGPAVGKSTLCGQIAEGAAKAGCAVVVASLELPSHMYYQKTIVRASGVPVGNDADAWLELGPVKAAIYDYTRTVGARMMCINRKMSAKELYQVVDEVSDDTDDPIVVAVDWIQLMPPAEERLASDERLAIKESMRGLRRIATDQAACVFAVSSVQRQGYSRKSLGLEMLGGASAVEYYADTVIHLRKSVETPNAIEANLIKNRYGSCGTATLMFDAPVATFRDL